MSDSNDSTPTRRSVLKMTSAGILGSGLVSSVSAGSSGDGRRGSGRRQSGEQTQTTLSDFEVTGEKTITVTYGDETVVKETQYRSEDLVDIMGADSCTTTDEYDQDNLPSDVPTSGQETTTESFTEHMATESQWAEVSKANRIPEDQRVQAQHDHDNRGDNFCGIGLYVYDKKKVKIEGSYDPWGGGYDYKTVYNKKSPINVIAKGYDVTDVEDIFDNAGYTVEGATGVLHWPRYAWDTSREKFIGPDQEPYSEYSFAVDGHFRRDGGYHFKFYEFEDGIVCIQAHEDSNAKANPLGTIGHEVVSYQTAIDEAVDVLTDDGGEEDGSKDLSNGSRDYDGEAPIVKGDKDSINKNGC